MLFLGIFTPATKSFSTKQEWGTPEMNPQEQTKGLSGLSPP
jgi:hypothetical protein